MIKNFANRKIIAGLAGIFLGAFGVHKFVLGLHRAGFLMLLLTLISCGVLAWLMGIVGIIEGILYLIKSDEEFCRLYQGDRKEWF